MPATFNGHAPGTADDLHRIASMTGATLVTMDNNRTQLLTHKKKPGPYGPGLYVRGCIVGLPALVGQELSVHGDHHPIALGIHLLLHVHGVVDGTHDAVAELLMD